MRRSLNVLLTQAVYPPSIGGAQEHVRGIARALAGRHRVEVVTFGSSHPLDWVRRTAGGSAREGADADGVTVSSLVFEPRELCTVLPGMVALRLGRSAAASRLAALILPKLRRAVADVDVVHHGWVGRVPLGLASLWLARERGVPFVLTPFHHHGWDGRRVRLCHALYRQADAVLALTPAEASALAALGVERARIRVVGTGPVLSPAADPEGFRARHALSGPIVLFVGRQVPYKGYGLILDAARRVWASHPDTRFVFIGPRTTASRLRFARTRDPRVLELGPVDLGTKTSALAASTLLCLPSAREGFGAVYLEAWLHGRPVIGVDIPAMRDVIDDGIDGYVSPPEPAALAARILSVLDDPARAARMGAAGRAKAGRYGWPDVSARVEDAYRTLVPAVGGQEGTSTC
jgi:glycosyltransferase involved in cell wall biosynthesis